MATTPTPMPLVTTASAPDITAPKLVLMGRQGAGKGTQAERLARHYGVIHLSTGDILRAEVRSGTVLGAQVGELISSGALVPDEVVIEIACSALTSPEVRRRGFLLDGFPRTVRQASALEDAFGATVIDAVLDLDVPTSVARMRLMSRRRSDDKPAAIDRRLAEYDAEAGPLREYYDTKGLLMRVDAVGEVDEIFSRIQRHLRPVIWGESLAVG
jgi:adenylate kinase